MKFFLKRCLCCGSASADVLCEGCERELELVDRKGCPCCGRPLYGLSGRCWACRDLDTAVAEIRARFWYRGLAKLLFQYYKFHRGWELTAYWIRSLRVLLDDPQAVLVPIPPSRSGLRERGWDPVETLWRGLCRRPFRGLRLLERQDGTEQKTLTRSERKRNLQGRFTLRRGVLVPTFVVLVDDTVTTGATLDECARLLLSAGCRSVKGISLTLAP